MYVSEIMTRDPICVGSDTSLDEVSNLMEKHDIRHVPVVEGRHLAGILSDRDVMEATGGLPGRVHACRGAGARDKIPSQAGEIAHMPVVTATPDQTALSAFVDMFGRMIGCLPVLEKGELVGIITETDALRVLYERCREGGWENLTVADKMTQDARTIDVGESLESARGALESIPIRHVPVLQNGRLVGVLSDRDLRRANGVGRPLDLPVEEVMTRSVVHVSPHRALSHAAEVMLEAKLSCLPVVEQEELVGILTVTDLLDYCVRLLSREPETDTSNA